MKLFSYFVYYIENTLKILDLSSFYTLSLLFKDSLLIQVWPQSVVDKYHDSPECKA